MTNLEVKQIFEDIDESNFNTITNWMYKWWGIDEGYSIEEIECYIKHSFQKNRLPQTYGLFLNKTIIGMYQFTYEDLTIRPDIYPWLANVYIDEKYRNSGYARYILNTVKKNAKKVLNYDELYLYTKHIGLYEKFGFEYVSDFDTYKKEPRIQKLYKLKISQ